MSFEDAVAFVLDQEGGVSDHPADSGGFTRWGLSSKSYPDLNLATLSKEKAVEIYRRDFWTAVRGDELHPAVALVLFDWAVNSGVHAAVENLQAVLGGLKCDGILGRQTLAAIDKADRAKLIRSLLQARVADRLHQAGRPDQRVFLRGWISRVVACAVESARQLA